ncbi:amidohydrolase family protein [Hymenobacter crusticola]|uniref:Amidohydrolase n=1 Tax=Hymenobacter crusticola TaxID=1770526 RepID=A0A243WD96_9BACT|nr:amidohydrolase family protein [Hymenobacter crusticola]OUJ73643.1 amidohydrolase [Hymenobacter crusticola]
MRDSSYYCLFAQFFIVLALNGCTASEQSSISNLKQNKIPLEDIYIIKNVNIIPMTPENKTIKNATVVIKNKKILSINSRISDKASSIIDGRGKWLIPGLIDMHVHNLADVNFSANYPTKGATLFAKTQHFMLLYIANAVTTVFELSARVEHFGQRNEILKGQVIGPRVALAFLIDGGNVSGNVANTPSDGRQTVRIAKAQGYEFIKLYSGLDTETFKAIVDEANKQGMKVVGHIPNAFRGRLREAFIPHFDMVAHAEEYSKQSKDLSDEDARGFATLAKNNGTWLTPTLTTMVWIANQTRSLDGVRNLPSLKYVHPLMQSKWLNSNHYNQETDPKRVARIDDMVNFHLRLVKAFKEAGVPIVAGTDAGVSGVVWGYSLHDELELLVKAGLTTEEALASATRLPATWLKLGDKIGTVEVGKYADLVLLDANPLENIHNTRKISGVFANGRWISKKIIGTMLNDLEKWNNNNKDKFDWKNRSEY